MVDILIHIYVAFCIVFTTGFIGAVIIGTWENRQ
jgi:hypothetical protein